MALPGSYRLPKEIGEMALRFIKDGMEPGQALGTARMLSNDPQDPVAVAYTKDLMGRLSKTRERFSDWRREPAYSSPLAAGTFEPVSGPVKISIPTTDRTLGIPSRYRRGSDESVILNEKTYIPRALQFVNATAGAERRLVAEVANAAAAGDRNAFLEILSELGFTPDIARNLANRYVPEIIQYNPTRGGLL